MLCRLHSRKRQVMGLVSRLTVKERGLVEGQHVEAVLARAEWHLEHEQVEAALRELERGLVGHREEWRLLERWVEQCRWRVHVERAVNVLSGEVQDRLAGAQRKLLALDDPLNDELSSVGSNQSGFLK